MSATATITPMTAPDSPWVNASAPAAPAASARTMSAGPTFVRAAMAGTVISTSNSKPTATAQGKATAIPVMFVTTARRNRAKSPNVVASDMATFGPNRGAMTIAPMMTATSSLSSPTAATTAERIAIPTKTNDVSSPSVTSEYISSRLIRCFPYLISSGFGGTASLSGSGSGSGSGLGRGNTASTGSKMT